MDELKLEIENLKNENQQLKDQLKKYTNPQRTKKYYEENKEILLKKRAERYQKEKEFKNN
jgi:hypothetical protein